MAGTEGRRATARRFRSLTESRPPEHTAALTATSFPATSVGQSLARLRPNINPRLYRGVKVMKICANGKMVSRTLTISRGNFVLFVTPSEVRGARTAEADGDDTFGLDFVAQRVRGSSLFGRKRVAKALDVKHTPRHVDIADITHVQRGLVGTRKLEYSQKKYLSSRSGSGKRTFARSSLKSDHIQNEDSIISIVHRDRNTLDLLIPNKKEREDFLEALHQIRSTYHSSKAHVGKEELLLRYIWYDVDMNKNGLIELSEMMKILDRINLYQKSSVTKKRYARFIKELRANADDRRLGARGEITFDQCRTFIRQQKVADGDRRQTMEDEIWEVVFGPHIESIDAETFLNRFLHGCQKEHDASIEDVKAIFVHLNLMEVFGGESTGGFEVIDAVISKNCFGEYLHSIFNDAYDPDRLQLTPSSLDRPLSHYWINSSHNTYLTGDQLQSLSSVEMYMSSLQRGCKCLELDCWDGPTVEGKRGEEIPVPVVYHGYTLTSKIRFEDIINCVRFYVDDHPDTYPIILSLENHCSREYQEVMARVLSDALGDKLFVPDRAELDKDLPSPNSLRGKVVVKGKRPPEVEDADDSPDGGEKEYDPYEGAEQGDSPTNEEQKKKAQPKIIPELARLTLFHGTKFKSFEKSMELPTSHMHSINETKIDKILGKDVLAATRWRQFNHHHMTRTYPAGMRVDSSNYDPVLAWSMGCQLVALNFQTADPPLIVNDGRFRENGGCGYILKPSWLTSAEDSSTASPTSPRIFRISILSGSCLPKPKAKSEGECIDPYVKMTLHDVIVAEDDENVSVASSDSSKKNVEERSVTEKTKYIFDNGFCPVWNEPFVEFSVHCPTVAMLRFSVMERDEMSTDEVIAQAAVPVSCLRNGYRSIQLFDRNNTRSGPFDFATLLVKIDFAAEETFRLK